MSTVDTAHTSFADERPLFEAELDAYYGAGPCDAQAWEDELHARSQCDPNLSPCRRKAMGYAFMAEHCPVHVFRHCPFYFEIATGRQRTDLGTGGLGGWLKREPFGQKLCASSNAWWQLCNQTGLSIGWPVLDDNHHTVGYETVLRLGLHGISVFGHLDRILIPYYRQDIASGRLTEPQTRDLIACFLAICDARFGMRDTDPWHAGTNSTVTLGGCDRDGTPVFNELTSG